MHVVLKNTEYIEENKKIVVVGGGFGGVKAALELAEHPLFDVTLISDQKDFKYYPTLYRSATGGSQQQSVIPLKDIFEGKRIELIHNKVVAIKRETKEIVTESGKSYLYDNLILALGSVTNYFGIKGLKAYSYGIKSIDEALELKQHLHQQMIDEHKPDVNYIVVGGGPTGVELAGALPAYIRHIMKKHGIKHRAVRVALVEAAPRLLPSMPKDVSRSVARRLRRLGIKLYLNKKVGGETAEALVVNSEPMESSTVVWTAGVTNHPLFAKNKFVLSGKGKVIVNQYLAAENDIYVLGDNADTLYSGMAQTALRDAVFVTGNLKLQAEHQPLNTYKPKKPIFITPAGPWWAAVVWGKVRIYGRLGWLLRRAADFIAYRDLEPWWRASQLWMEGNVSEEDCPVCAIATK